PADRPEVAPCRAFAAERIVADVARADAFGKRRRRLPRRFDDAPERLLVEVIVRDVARQRLGLGAPDEAARPARTRDRPVQAAERLEADEVAEHEHVERDLKPKLALDLSRGVGALTGLVVLHHPPGAERVDVDPVDLSGERQASSELEATLQLGRCPLAAE